MLGHQRNSIQYVYPLVFNVQEEINPCERWILWLFPVYMCETYSAKTLKKDCHVSKQDIFHEAS